MKARQSPADRRVLAAVVAMVAVYFFSYFQRTAIPGTIFDPLQADLHLSATAVAGLGAVFLQIYAWMQLVAGLAADHLGGRRSLLAGGVVMCAGALAFPHSHSLTTLYASRAVTALGASFMYLSIVKETDRLFPPHRFPAIIGAVLMAGYLGGVTATLPFERAVAAWGWRASLTGAAMAMAMVLVLAFAALRGLPAPPPRAHGFSLRPLAQILANPLTRPLLLCSAINFPVYFSIQTVLGKKFLQDFCGLSSAWAAGFMLVMMLTSAVSTLAGGLLLRWTGHRRKPILIGAVLVLMTAVLVLLAGMQVRAGGWLFLGACMLMAVSTGASPAALAAMKELSPPAALAQAIAVGNCVTYVGVGAVAWMGGLVLDLHRAAAVASATGIVYPPQAYSHLFYLLLALLTLSLFSVLRVRETRGQSAWPATAEPL